VLVFLSFFDFNDFINLYSLLGVYKFPCVDFHLLIGIVLGPPCGLYPLVV
jgi:hypothetical protein